MKRDIETQSFTLRVPEDLLQIDELMVVYANSIRSRHKAASCGSIEKRYRPANWERNPTPVTLPEYRWYELHRIIHFLPELHRHTLAVQYEYDEHGLSARHCRRRGVRSRQRWWDIQISALRMIRNRLRVLTPDEKGG